MTAKTPQSRKAKGQIVPKELKALILHYYPELKSDDIRIVPSGVPGVDLWFSDIAKQYLRISPECKFTEKLNFWEAWEQAENHAKNNPGTIPVVVFRRSRSKLLITLETKEFLNLMRY